MKTTTRWRVIPVTHGRDARATMASWHGRPGHDTKLDRFVNFVSTKWTQGRPLEARAATQGRPYSLDVRRATITKDVCFFASLVVKAAPYSVRRASIPGTETFPIVTGPQAYSVGPRRRSAPMSSSQEASLPE